MPYDWLIMPIQKKGVDLILFVLGVVIPKICILYYLKMNIKEAIFNIENKLTRFNKFLFRICYKKELKTGRLKFSYPLRAAIFLIMLPLYLRSGGNSHKVKFDEMVGVARVASECELYRKYLVEKSMHNCFKFNDINFENSILNSNEIDIRGQNEAGERNLQSRLNGLTKAKITYFTVTGQISERSIDIIKNSKNNIETLDVFITSPMILSHNAIKNLQIEYSSGNIIDMSHQFLRDKNLDLVRRSIKILDNIEKIYNSFKHLESNFSIYCFKEENPRVKIVIIKNNYAQFKLGGLGYPSNMYRFGFDITDINIVKQLSDHVNSIINDERVEKIDFCETGFEGIKMRVIKELVIFLITHNYKKKDLIDITDNMKDVLKTESSLSVFNILIKEFDVSYNSMMFSLTQIPKLIGNKIKTRQYASDFVLGKGKSHITVAMLFLRNDRIFIIKKKKGYYKDKWSIVAGHIDSGESPKYAIKREVREEIGIDINNFSLIKYFDQVDGDVCNGGMKLHSWYVYICYEKIDQSKIVLSKDEISEAKWINFKHIDKYDMTETSKKILQQFNFG